MSRFARRLSAVTQSTTPPSDSLGWQESVDLAVAEQDWTPIVSWYSTHTGHEALGYAKEDLVSGSLVSQYDGQVFEGISGSVIRVAHNNVTIRGCRVTDGGIYGCYLNPTFDAPVTGLLIEYCTFERVLPTGEDGTGDNSIYMQPAYSSNPGYDVVIRNCNSFGWTAGFRLFNKVYAEYNWIHDMQHPVGGHANSIRIGRSGPYAYRNYGTDGSSNTFAIYFDKEQNDNCTYRENIASGQSTPEGQGGPSYLIGLKAGEYEATATNIKIIDNMYGPGYQYGYFAGGGGISWGANGNERTGNYDLMSGALQGNV